MRAFSNYNNLGTPIFNNNNSNNNNSNSSSMLMKGVRYQRVSQGCYLTLGVVKDEFAFMSEMEKRFSNRHNPDFLSDKFMFVS